MASCEMKILNSLPISLDHSKYDIIVGRGLLQNIASLISKYTRNKKVVIVGEKDLKQGKVTVKDMTTGKDEKLEVKSL